MKNATSTQMLIKYNKLKYNLNQKLENTQINISLQTNQEAEFPLNLIQAI